jgi:hypothetical protein
MAVVRFLVIHSNGYTAEVSNEDLVDTIKFALEELKKTNPEKVEAFFGLINPPERKIGA